MYLVRWSGGSVAFPVEGLEAALQSPHPHSRERAASLLLDSFELAEAHAARLRSDGHEALVVRAGRQSDARSARSRSVSDKSRLGVRTNEAGSLVVHDRAWELPEGFVDTEADKHGPAIHVPITTLAPARTAKEKAEWYNNYKPAIKTCLWQ